MWYYHTTELVPTLICWKVPMPKRCPVAMQVLPPREVAKTISANISEIKEHPKLSPEQRDAQIA